MVDGGRLQSVRFRGRGEDVKVERREEDVDLVVATTTENDIVVVDGEDKGDE